MKDSFFTRRMFYRFFVPSVISTFCLAIANLVDALCVGMLLGEPALAAIDLVSPIYMIYNVLDVGMGVGGAVVFTRFLSEGHARKALSVFRQMFMAALSTSVFVAVVGVLFLEPILQILGTQPEHGAVYDMTRDYALRLFLGAPLFFLNFLFYNFVRCDDGEKLASVAMTVANLLDVGLTFVLVLGLNMGVKGAIYATLIGTGAGVLIHLIHFLHPGNLLRLRFEKPDFTAIAQYYMTGFSSSSQYIFQFFLFLVVNNLLMHFHGAQALAVYNVVLNISYLVVGLFDGVSSSVQPLAAIFYGERNLAGQRQCRTLGLKWGMGLGLLLLVTISMLAPEIAAIFGLSEEMKANGVLALRCYCAGGLLIGVSMIFSAYWQAVGQEKRTMQLTFLRAFLIYLLLAVPLAFGTLERFWLVFPGTEALSLVVFLIWCRLSRLDRKNGAQSDQVPVFQHLLQGEDSALFTILDQVETFCDEQGASMTQRMLVNMAVEEMCAAIFSHAGIDREFYIQITLFRANQDVFELHIRDSGKAFDPFSLRTKKINEAEDEEEAMDSMGILMVKKKAKEFSYRNYQGFNTLTVRI